jgi:4a-hydroxytetrahydrobiopterin dehydratase
MTLLGDDGVRDALSSLPGWSGDASAISRTVEAPDFPTGIRIVDDVAAAAEAADHHPDIDIRWRTLRLSLTTHFKGGITSNDVALADRIDTVISELSA